MLLVFVSLFFFFNDTATTEIYTLSLHDALPICARLPFAQFPHARPGPERLQDGDRKSTRLNSSHDQISYAVFCLKKNNNNTPEPRTDIAWRHAGFSTQLDSAR